MEQSFMNLLKVICIVSFYCIPTVCCSISNGICVNSTANDKMFGTVQWADFLNASFIMAFEDENFSNYIINSAKNESQLVKQISKRTVSQCGIVLGLFTSRDCLIAGKILKKNKTIALSSSCSNEQIKKYYPYIYTMTPKQLNYSKAVANYLNANMDANKIYAFYQPSDIYSRDGFKHFHNNLEKKVIPVPVKNDGSFDLATFKNTDTDTDTEKLYYVFFTYPLPSAQIISRLDGNKMINKNITLIGASSWMYQLSVFYSIKSILLKSRQLLTPNLVDKKRVTQSKFAQEFKKKFHRNPDVVEILTYDATRLSIQCYRFAQLRGKTSRSNFLKCLNNGPHVSISGDVLFPKGSPFAKRKIYIDDMLKRLS